MMDSPWQRRREMALAALCFGAALLLYLRTLAPGVIALDDDSLEFQLLAHRGGIAHPTGYPLFTILLWLAARLLPVGEVATRANLLSALLAAATVALSYLAIRRSGTGRGAALVGAALLAVIPTFWAQATVVEAYSLHFLIAASLVLALLSEAPLPLIALIVGLGLAHHRLIVLWLPAALLCLALTRPALLRPQRRWLLALGALLLPLLFYLWLPLRAEVGSVDGSYQAGDFFCWVRACHYEQSFLGQDNELAQRVPPTFFLDQTFRELGAVGVALAALGLLVVARARPALAALVVAAIVPSALFALNFIVPDREVFWLPVLWLMALLVGWGVEGGARLLAARTRGQARAWLLPLLPLVALGWVATRAVAAFPAADRSAIILPTLAGEAINGADLLGQPLPDDATIIGLLGEISYLRYLQETAGIAPTVRTDGGDSEAARRDAIARALSAGRRPFLTRPLAGIEQDRIAALGPLLELRPAPLDAAPPPFARLDAPMGEGIRLVGWLLSPVAGSDEIRLTLLWQAAGPTSEPLALSLRALDRDGQPLESRDRPPLRGAYPTTRWPPDELIQDTHEVAPAPPDGHYLLILYRASDGSEVGRVTLPP